MIMIVSRYYYHILKLFTDRFMKQTIWNDLKTNLETKFIPRQILKQIVLLKQVKNNWKWDKFIIYMKLFLDIPSHFDRYHKKLR